MSWQISGTYFESCNCEAICPCRRIDGVPGGRSTHGVCAGVLSWLIEEGCVDEVDLAGQPVALAMRYSDDEPGSPETPRRISRGHGKKVNSSVFGSPGSTSSTRGGGSGC
jgi:hypothetical protein